MDFRFLYLDTQGRIGRKAWWLGSAGLVVIWIVVGFVVGAFGLIFGLQRSALGLGVMQLLITVILFRPVYALSLKRLHDRNRSERFFWMFFTPSFVVIVLAMLGLSGTLVEAEILGQSVKAFKANALGRAASLIALIAVLWAVYELGFRKGGAARAAAPVSEPVPAATIDKPGVPPYEPPL